MFTVLLNVVLGFSLSKLFGLEKSYNLKNLVLGYSTFLLQYFRCIPVCFIVTTILMWMHLNEFGDLSLNDAVLKSQLKLTTTSRLSAWTMPNDKDNKFGQIRRHFTTLVKFYWTFSICERSILYLAKC